MGPPLPLPPALPLLLPLLLALPAAWAAAVPEVRLGGLFPMFKAERDAFQLDLAGVRRFAAFQLALREINNKSDGLADQLLPRTRLLFTWRDSQRSDAASVEGAFELTRSAFGGAGVHAIVGAASSGPSIAAALVAGRAEVPQVSYASTSALLSDGRAYPYFLRTAPSDAFQGQLLADVIGNQFGFDKVATVASNDGYGLAGISSFHEAARALGIEILTRQTFEGGAVDLDEPIGQLLASRARVAVLFCQAADGGHFLLAAYDAGFGGEGHVWFGADALMRESLWLHAGVLLDEQLRLAVLRGFFGAAPSTQRTSERYRAFARRLAATAFDGCDEAVDDDGTPLWVRDHDGNASTPRVCVAHDGLEDSYAPYAYDATYALAYALHDLIETQGVPQVDGPQLYETLLRRVSFAGITGNVSFYDASLDPDRRFHGDRRQGIEYDVYNYAGVAAGLVRVATWALGDTFGERFRWVDGHSEASVVWSTADNSIPTQLRPLRCPAGEGTGVVEGVVKCVRCAEGSFSARDDDSACEACPAGSYQPREGSTSCEPCAVGFFQPEAKAACLPCPTGVSSLGGSTSCGVCAEGYLLSPARGATPSSASCLPCADGMVCGWNTTVGTVALREGYWRASAASTDIRRCSLAAATCAGGGAAACADGHAGPRCEACAHASQYRVDEGRACADCPDLQRRLWLLFGALAGGGIAAAAAAAALARRAPRVWRAGRRAGVRLRRWLSVHALVPKAKIVFAFLQTARLLPTVYGLKLPESYYAWLRFLAVFQIDWSELVYPGLCLPGGFFAQLLVVTLTPIVAVAVAIFGSMAAGRANRTALSLRQSVFRVLPLVLLVAFCFTPSTSRSIFAVWSCETFEVDSGATPPTTVRYLIADLRIKCDYSDEAYLRLLALAYVVVPLWPIGVPLLFSLLLAASWSAIRRGHVNRLVGATSFLHREYIKDFYWWEVFFLVQRLVIVGFLQWLSLRSHRVLSGMLIAVLYLIALFAAKPYKRQDVGCIAYGAQTAVVILLLLAMFVHYLTVLQEEVDHGHASELYVEVTGFNSVDDLAGTMVFALLLILTVICAGTLYQLVLHLGDKVVFMRLSTTSEPPELTLQPGKRYHLFLSHVWSTGQDQVATIKTRLLLMLPSSQIFRDVDDLDDISRLHDNVIASQCVLLFLSKGYFFSKNCLLEINTALRFERPLVLVNETEAIHGGMTMDSITSDCTSQGIQVDDLFRGGRELISWYRVASFQQLSLIKIAQHMLHASPNFSHLSDPPELYIPGELSKALFELPRPVHLLASARNPGAAQMAEEILARFPDLGLEIDEHCPKDWILKRRRSSANLSISSSSASWRHFLRRRVRLPPRNPTSPRSNEVTHMLLYLNQHTFTGDDGRALSREVRQAFDHDVQVILAHENDLERNGCDFDRLLLTTPQELIELGLYRHIAVPMYPEPYRNISIALLIKAMGGVTPRFQLPHVVRLASRSGSMRRSRTLCSRAALDDFSGDPSMDVLASRLASRQSRTRWLRFHTRLAWRERIRSVRPRRTADTLSA
ncbi:hypothetical protein AB1Y20_011008 [Prymnesium parvum]|uniref:Receptor ligand binding region domain-containing protein n=1 Tax=Prymnesium parvum TaxID=97485 RepID=A0AB34INC1_PRYPA